MVENLFTLFIQVRSFFFANDQQQACKWEKGEVTQENTQATNTCHYQTKHSLGGAE